MVKTRSRSQATTTSSIASSSKILQNNNNKKSPSIDNFLTQLFSVDNIFDEVNSIYENAINYCQTSKEKVIQEYDERQKNGAVSNFEPISVPSPAPSKWKLRTQQINSFFPSSTILEETEENIRLMLTTSEQKPLRGTASKAVRGRGRGGTKRTQIPNTINETTEEKGGDILHTLPIDTSYGRTKMMCGVFGGTAGISQSMQDLRKVGLSSSSITKGGCGGVNGNHNNIPSYVTPGGGNTRTPRSAPDSSFTNLSKPILKESRANAVKEKEALLAARLEETRKKKEERIEELRREREERAQRALDRREKLQAAMSQKLPQQTASANKKKLIDTSTVKKTTTTKANVTQQHNTSSAEFAVSSTIKKANISKTTVAPVAVSALPPSAPVVSNKTAATTKGANDKLQHCKSTLAKLMNTKTTPQIVTSEKCSVPAPPSSSTTSSSVVAKPKPPAAATAPTTTAAASLNVANEEVKTTCPALTTIPSSINTFASPIFAPKPIIDSKTVTKSKPLQLNNAMAMNAVLSSTPIGKPVVKPLMTTSPVKPMPAATPITLATATSMTAKAGQKRKSSYSNLPLSPFLNSDNSDDEASQPAIKIPRWATKDAIVEFKELLMENQKVNWKSVFRPAELIPLQLENIFRGRKFREKARTSSAVWSPPKNERNVDQQQHNNSSNHRLRNVMANSLMDVTSREEFL